MGNEKRPYEETFHDITAGVLRDAPEHVIQYHYDQIINQQEHDLTGPIGWDDEDSYQDDDDTHPTGKVNGER